MGNDFVAEQKPVAAPEDGRTPGRLSQPATTGNFGIRIEMSHSTVTLLARLRGLSTP